MDEVHMKGRFIIDDRKNHRFRVARETFTSEPVLKRELATIFRRCWLYIGHESEIAKPGDFVTRSVGRRNLIFLRDRKGEARAVFNSCSHRGAEVCRERQGNAKTFQCIYHGWVFRDDGRLLHRSGDEAFAPVAAGDTSLDLTQVPRLEQYRGFYFFNLDSNAISLRDYLGRARDYIDLIADQSRGGMIVVGGTQEYAGRANWKLLAENSIDIYHGSGLHPTYIDYLKSTTGALDPMSGLGGVARDLGQGHGVVEYQGPWGRPIAKWIPAWGEEGKAEIEKIHADLVQRLGKERADRISHTNRNLLIFPNFVINDIGAITLRTFQPTEVGHMNITSWAIAPEEENERFLRRRLDNFLEFLGPAGFATPDDLEALESCQRGFDNTDAGWSEVSKGMVLSDNGQDEGWEDEGQIRSFWRKWQEYVE